MLRRFVTRSPSARRATSVQQAAPVVTRGRARLAWFTPERGIRGGVAPLTRPSEGGGRYRVGTKKGAALYPIPDRHADEHHAFDDERTNHVDHPNQSDGDPEQNQNRQDYCCDVPDEPNQAWTVERHQPPPKGHRESSTRQHPRLLIAKSSLPTACPCRHNRLRKAGLRDPEPTKPRTSST